MYSFWQTFRRTFQFVTTYMKSSVELWSIKRLILLKNKLSVLFVGKCIAILKRKREKCLAGTNYKEEKWRNGDKKSS